MERRLQFFVELFSVATGVSFLAAAVVQTILFSIWGLDFTALASVEDVIMSGIRMLVIVGSITLVGVLFTIAGHIFDTERSRNVSSFSWWRVGVVLILTATYLAAQVVIIYSHLMIGIRLATIVMTMFIYATGVVVVFVLTSSISLTETFRYSRKALGYFIAMDIFLAVIVMFLLLGGGYPGLRLEPVSVLPEGCRAEHEILWIGSRTLVVECRGEINAIVRSDTPFILRPTPPDEPLA